MTSMIKDIYNTLIQRTKFTDKISRDLEKEINELLKREERQMDTLEFEHYRNNLYEVATAAEEGGFIKGFRQGVLLMTECFAQDDMALKP